MSLINPKHSAEEIARNIASRAIENSNNPNKPSPFQLKATAAGIAHRGGKKDDISIIVAVVR